MNGPEPGSNADAAPPPHGDSHDAGAPHPLLEHLAEHLHNAGRAGSRQPNDPGSDRTRRAYRELPEAEKHLAREAAATVLQGLSRLGYTIGHPPGGGHSLDQAVADDLAEFQSHRKNARKLRQLWKQRAKHRWPAAPALYTTSAELLCLHGEAFAAVDVCQEGLRHFPGHVRLIQLKAWALAQSGAVETARELLESLDEHSTASAETWGLLARTWKDLAANESDADRKRGLLATASRHYERGYTLSVEAGRPDYYPAINCATLHLRLGEREAAHAWAERAIQLAAQEPRAFWAEATLGEAALLLGQIDRAQQHYRAFAAACGQQRAAISSARRQATEILGSSERVAELLGDCLSLPPVAISATGVELLREPGGATVICPWTRETAGKVSALLTRGAEIHLVLPLSLDACAQEFLDLAPAELDLWRTQAASITVAHAHGSQLTDELAGFCALLQVGRARRLADTWATALHFAPPPVTLAADGPVLAYHTTLRALHEGREDAALPGIARAMAFVDVVGYGQLNEAQVAFFQQRLLPRIAEFLRALASPPLFVQIWGDALYLGFAGVREGGLAMLALRRFFATIPWREIGFGQPLKLRIALHSGPVLTATDPFSGTTYFTGTVVSRAARIEPLADEDQIFCSDAFAAVASARRIDDFSCAFAGTYLLPKNAGEEPLFRLLPASRLTGSAVSARI